MSHPEGDSRAAPNRDLPEQNQLRGGTEESADIRELERPKPSDERQREQCLGSRVGDHVDDHVVDVIGGFGGEGSQA